MLSYASWDASLAVFLVSEDHIDSERLGAIPLTQRLGATPRFRAGCSGSSNSITYPSGAPGSK